MVRLCALSVIVWSVGLPLLAVDGGIGIEAPQPDPHDRHAAAATTASEPEPAGYAIDPLARLDADAATPLRRAASGAVLWGPVVQDDHRVVLRLESSPTGRLQARVLIDDREPVPLPVQTLFRRVVVGPLVAGHLRGDEIVDPLTGPFTWWLIKDGRAQVVRQPLEVQYVDDELGFEVLSGALPAAWTGWTSDRQQKWIDEFWRIEASLWEAADQPGDSPSPR